MGTAVDRLAEQRVVSAPVFDEDTFDQDYFTKVSNYAGRYDSYNPPHKIAGYLREIRRLRAGGTLLDAGCAFGRFLEDARRHFQCEGVDISAYALGVARQRLPEIPLYRDAVQTFAPGRTYDVITAFDMLEHVPDLDTALASLRRLLAPSGILALAVPVYDTPAGWFFGLIDRDPTHVHRLSRWEWLSRLQQAGLRPVVRKGILRIPLPGYFVHYISPLLWWCSQAIFVVCEIGGEPPADAGGAHRDLDG
jgi:SAM-dependent methyltransferase